VWVEEDERSFSSWDSERTGNNLYIAEACRKRRLEGANGSGGASFEEAGHGSLRALAEGRKLEREELAQNRGEKQRDAHVKGTATGYAGEGGDLWKLAFLEEQMEEELSGRHWGSNKSVPDTERQKRIEREFEYGTSLWCSKNMRGGSARKKKRRHWTGVVPSVNSEREHFRRSVMERSPEGQKGIWRRDDGERYERVVGDSTRGGIRVRK